MSPPLLTEAQGRALLLARRNPLYRTPHGWKGRGTPRVQHQTVNALIGKGLLTTANRPSLHTLPTPAGHEAAEALTRKKG